MKQIIPWIIFAVVCLFGFHTVTTNTVRIDQIEEANCEATNDRARGMMKVLYEAFDGLEEAQPYLVELEKEIIVDCGTK